MIVLHVCANKPNFENKNLDQNLYNYLVIQRMHDASFYRIINWTMMIKQQRNINLEVQTLNFV